MGFFDKLFGGNNIPAPTPQEFDKDIFMEFVRLLTDDPGVIEIAERCAENPRKSYKENADPRADIKGLSHKDAAWYRILALFCEESDAVETGSNLFDFDVFSAQMEEMSLKRDLPYDVSWFDVLDDDNTDYVDHLAVIAGKWPDYALPAFDVDAEGICVVSVCKKEDYARVKEITENFFGRKLVE